MSFIGNYKEPDANGPVAFGISGRLVLQPGSQWTDNEYGMDTLIRPYIALTREIARLLPERGTPDLWIPTLRKYTHVVTEGRGLTSSVSISFQGLVKDKIPQTVVVGGWTEATTQLSTIRRDDNGLDSLDITDGADVADTDETGEVNVTFQSPTTTFRYITRKRPTGPKYAGKLLAGTSDFEIVDTQPASYKGRLVYAREVRTVRFDVEPVGAYFQVTEVSQGFLVSRKVRRRVLAGGFNANLSLQLAGTVRL